MYSNGPKKFTALVLICVLTVGCFSPTAEASGSPGNHVIYVEDMECEQLRTPYTSIAPYAFGTINDTIGANSFAIVRESLYMEADETVTINCSYSPASTSVDFGLLDSNNVFHYVNVTNGSVNQTIRISSRGYYSVAIRNNSSRSISVTGYVNY